MKKYSYSEIQRVFALAWVANQKAKIAASAEVLEQQFKPQIINLFNDPKIIGMIGKWELIWGPKIYEAHEQNPAIKQYADNTMFMAQEVGTTNYVVSIAGTDPYSLYGWLAEDFNVKHTVSWKYNESSAAENVVISKGASIGLNILANKLKDDKNGYVIDYIKQLVGTNSNSTITVTGHSLGGCLSPSMALAIYDSLGDSLSKTTVKTMSFAGPTPGNKAFADYYNERIGTNTTRVWNTMDLIPHSWQLDQMKQVPYLYKGSLKPSLLVKLLVNRAIKFSSGTVYIQSATSHPLQGTYNPNPHTAPQIVTKDEKNASKSFSEELAATGSYHPKVVREVRRMGKQNSRVKRFFAQVGYQHVAAYLDLLKINDFYAQMVKSIPVPAKQKIHISVSELITIFKKVFSQDTA